VWSESFNASAVLRDIVVTARSEPIQILEKKVAPPPAFNRPVRKFLDDLYGEQRVPVDPSLRQHLWTWLQWCPSGR